MPDAVTLRAYAEQLDNAAIELVQTASRVTGADLATIVRGGRLEAVITQAVDSTRANVAIAITQMHAMAAQCRERATISDAHEQAMNSYEIVKGHYDRMDERDKQFEEPPIRPAALSWNDS